MGTVKQIDIINRTYYFHNDIIDIKNFDPILLTIDKKSYKDMVYTILDILQLKKLMIAQNIDIANPLYLLINRANGYIEEKGVSKCLFFHSTDGNKELLKQYN